MIPYSLRNHDTLNKLTQMTINILAWSNGIFSAPREIANGEVHNLVFVIHHHQKIPLEKAMLAAAAMHNQEVENLVKLESQITYFSAEIDAEITKYISGLHAWIRGNLDWYAHSGRYQITEKLELMAS